MRVRACVRVPVKYTRSKGSPSKDNSEQIVMWCFELINTSHQHKSFELKNWCIIDHSETTQPQYGGSGLLNNAKWQRSRMTATNQAKLWIAAPLWRQHPLPFCFVQAYWSLAQSSSRRTRSLTQPFGITSYSDSCGRWVGVEGGAGTGGVAWNKLG